MKKISILAIVFSFCYAAMAQDQEYFKTTDMKGFPSLLKQAVKYQSVSNALNDFNIDEATYNSIFYQNFVTENANNAKFTRFYAVFLKKFVLKPQSFPQYQFILNPKLETGFYSKHRVAISQRENAITTEFQTNFVEIVFPEKILQTKDEKPSSILATLEKGMAYSNISNLNTFAGISINDIRDFSMPPSVIIGSFISLDKFDKAEFKFINDETYEFPYLIIDNNQLSNFINKYKQVNKYINIKDLRQYKSAIRLKNVQSTVTLDKSLKCDISEIYFFDNCIAGILEFSTTQDTKLLRDLNAINTIVNRGEFKLKANGDFPSIIHQYKNTYYKIEQESKVIKMYFVIVK